MRPFPMPSLLWALWRLILLLYQPYGVSVIVPTYC